MGWLLRSYSSGGALRWVGFMAKVTVSFPGWYMRGGTHDREQVVNRHGVAGAVLLRLLGIIRDGGSSWPSSQ